MIFWLFNSPGNYCVIIFLQVYVFFFSFLKFLFLCVLSVVHGLGGIPFSRAIQGIALQVFIPYFILNTFSLCYRYYFTLLVTSLHLITKSAHLVSHFLCDSSPLHLLAILFGICPWSLIFATNIFNLIRNKYECLTTTLE